MAMAMEAISVAEVEAALGCLDGNGSIDYGEFVQFLLDLEDLAISMADIKRLRKTLVHDSSAARSPRIGLIEVDCDLGAGIPGAGSGIELLKQAASRQQALRRISEHLIEEIEVHQRPRANAAEVGHAGDHTPHARHIHTISRVMGETAALVDDLGRRGLFPVVLGGDHSTAAGTIASLRRAHPDSRLGVVWIDAHADLHSPYTTPSGNMHGIPVVTTEEVRRIGPERAAAFCLGHLASCDLIYVSFDVDSMDAPICKGTGTPVEGGLWAEEASRINRALLADPRVCCWEICEINPHLDTLDSLAEISLGVFQGVLEVLEQRLAVPSA